MSKLVDHTLTDVSIRSRTSSGRLENGGAFWYLGEPSSFDPGNITAGIAAGFDVSLWVFLPLVLVLGLAVAGAPPGMSIMLGALAGGLLAVVRSPEQVISFADSPELASGFALVKGVWTALANGYVSDHPSPAVQELLSRGGMESMLTTIWLIAIVLPGRMFKSAFEQRRLAPVVLSRAVGDSATVTSALIPWNSRGAYMAATLGVAVTSFAPYALFNILNPIVTVLFGFFGWRMLRSDAQPSEVSESGN